MADVNIQEIFDEYDLQIGKLTGENLRLKKVVSAYEAAEREDQAVSESSDT